MDTPHRECQDDYMPLPPELAGTSTGFDPAVDLKVSLGGAARVCEDAA